MSNNQKDSQPKDDEAEYLDPLSKAMIDLRGNEAFHRFLNALRDQVCMVDQESQTGDQAIRLEGQRSIVIALHNTMTELINE